MSETAILTVALPARESAQQKGRRYLIEGRLLIHQAAPGFIDATCRGDGAAYRLGFTRGRWWCSCPARGRCAHLFAVGLVVAVEDGRA